MLCRIFEDVAEIIRGDDVLSLIGVELHRAKEMYTGDDILSGGDLEALVLHFPTHMICVACDGETDELHISDAVSFDDTVTSSLSGREPWSSAIGKELFAAWSISNYGGFPDGFQVEFGPIGADVRIQIDGAASQIRFWTVEQCSR